MNKSFIITFSVSIIIFATAAVIMLMLLLPKQLVSLKTSVEKYQSIEKANYTYTKTKDISKEALLKEYKVSYDDMNVFKDQYKYVPGNSDPFYRGGSTSTTVGTGKTSGNTASAATPAEQAKQKTTNSNGGVPNPESTSK